MHAIIHFIHAEIKETIWVYIEFSGTRDVILIFGLFRENEDFIRKETTRHPLSLLVKGHNDTERSIPFIYSD